MWGAGSKEALTTVCDTPKAIAHEVSQGVRAGVHGKNKLKSLLHGAETLVYHPVTTGSRWSLEHGPSSGSLAFIDACVLKLTRLPSVLVSNIGRLSLVSLNSSGKEEPRTRPGITWYTGCFPHLSVQGDECPQQSRPHQAGQLPCRGQRTEVWAKHDFSPGPVLPSHFIPFSLPYSSKANPQARRKAVHWVLAHTQRCRQRSGLETTHTQQVGEPHLLP